MQLELDLLRFRSLGRTKIQNIQYFQKTEKQEVLIFSEINI